MSNRTANPEGPPVLEGRGLSATRVVWVVLAVLVVGLFVWSLPSYYERLLTPCAGGDSCFDWQLSKEGMRAAKDLGLSAHLLAAVGVVAQALFAAVWCAVGMLVFWRRSRDPGALVVGLFLVVFGITSGDPLDSSVAGPHPGLELLIHTTGFLGTALLILFFYVFPDGRFVPRRGRWVALAWAVAWAPSYFLPGSPLSLDNASPPVILAFLLGFVLSGVAAQVYRYRRVSDPARRQQTKWAVFGVAAAMGGFAALLLVEATFPALQRSGTLTYIATQPLFPTFMLFIPLSIGVAMVRSRLYDVDVLINRTLVYGTLTVSLALVYFGSVVVLQYGLRALTGESSQVAVVASTLVIAALFNPLHRRVQDLIDRLFYRRRYDAAKTLEEFGHRLRDEVDLETLTGELVAVVEQTIQPAHVSLWLRDRDRSIRMQKYR